MIIIINYNKTLFFHMQVRTLLLINNLMYLISNLIIIYSDIGIYEYLHTGPDLLRIIQASNFKDFVETPVRDV